MVTGTGLSSYSCTPSGAAERAKDGDSPRRGRRSTQSPEPLDNTFLPFSVPCFVVLDHSSSKKLIEWLGGSRIPTVPATVARA